MQASVPNKLMCRASKRHKPGDKQPAEEQQPASPPPAAPWTVDLVQTPSGRALRGVKGWLDSGIELSCVSDQAARLLDMAAEQILGVFGDPYGGPAATPPRTAPRATGKGATSTRGSRAGNSAGPLWFGVMLWWCKTLVLSRMCRLCSRSHEGGPGLRRAAVCDAVAAAARLERQAWRERSHGPPAVCQEGPRCPPSHAARARGTS